MSGLTRTESELVSSIDPRPILDRTLAWAQVNSGTANLAGLSRMADLLAREFEVLPGTVELVEPTPVEKVDAGGAPAPIEHGRHLVVRVRPGAKRRVLLTGHMDTVYGADHPFQSCEWIDANTLRGPGTADMKGGLSLMLAGLCAFEATGPSLGYDVLIDSDEETGSLSSAGLIAELACNKVAAFTYEPSLADGAMARSRPGSGNFACVVTGRSAHAGRNPEDGRNAILAASDLALRLARARAEGLSVNPARIEGGGPNNMVPALAVLHVNMRPATDSDLVRARAAIDEAVKTVARENDVAIAVHGGFNRPPKPVSRETASLFELVREAGSALGEDLVWKDTGGVCDGNNIAACNVAVIDTMGACGGAIHSPDEHLFVDSLLRRASLTALVMHRLERGNRP